MIIHIFRFSSQLVCYLGLIIIFKVSAGITLHCVTLCKTAVNWILLLLLTTPGLVHTSLSICAVSTFSIQIHVSIYVKLKPFKVNVHSHSSHISVCVLLILKESIFRIPKSPFDNTWLTKWLQPTPWD